MDTDQHLVNRARQGDHLAFGQLVDRHQSSVYQAARAIVASAVEAEDVVQEAWMHAYMHLARFRGTASFKTWVHTIVRNRAIDHYRAVRRQPWHAETRAATISARAEFCSNAPSPEELAVATELGRRLAKAIGQLPCRLRSLIRLWSTGQYSYEQMAQIAGITIGTTKSRVWQARQRVRYAVLLRRDLENDLRGGVAPVVAVNAHSASASR
jgi:RNA polymerase sigma-70 factor (ECF subfamily)